MAATRLVRLDDAPVLAHLLSANREFLRPWHPRRTDRFYSRDGQADAIKASLEQRVAGMAVPLVIVDDADEVVGSLTIASIIRGFFQSCSVGFWLAEAAQGRGFATRALREATDFAFGELRLHRVQAESLPENRRSQAVLKRVGFANYGRAPAYLKINGEWREHLLFQLVNPEPQLVNVPD